MRDFVSAFVRNRVFANVLLLIIVVVGLLATANMIREFFPEVSVDVVTVTVPFPGADPEEVEEGISRKIEEALENVEGIKRYHTVSREHVGSAQIEVDDGADLDEVTDRVRNAVDAISTFPIDAEKPIISEVTFRQEVLYLALWGELSEQQLKEWAEEIKDELQRHKEISQVTMVGLRDYEIAIELSEERLREYGLTFADVSRVVRRESLNLSAGIIRTKGEEIRIRTVGRNYTGADFASIVVLSSPDGEIVTLDRLATIDDGFTEDAVLTTFNGEPCVLMTLYKTSSEDALAIAAATKKFVKRKNQELPDGVNISTFFDETKGIRARINLLTRNGMIGLTLVFMLLWLFLEFRLSFWVAMGIPISLAGAIGIMWAVGGSINMLSLFALIMVLGIIVDDAIVVGEAIYVHRKRGEGPLDAAVAGVMEVGMPVIAAVTTTIIAFLPLGFSAGVMGKLIKIVPVGVIAALLISLVECLFLLPAHLNHLPDLNAPVEPGHPWLRWKRRFRSGLSGGLEWFVDNVYTTFVSFAVRWRYVTLSVAIAAVLVTVGIVRGGFVKFVTFPKVDGDMIISTIEFPDGTPTEVTRNAVEKTRQALEQAVTRFESVSGEPIVKNVFTTSGSMIEDRNRRVSSNVGQVMVELLDTEKRGVHFENINVAWGQELEPIPGVISQTFTGIETGPGGAEIEIYLQGEDMDMLLAASADLKDKLRSYDGVYQVRDDYRPGKTELRLDLKPEAHALGLKLDDLARQVYAGYYGEEAVRIQRGRDDIRVKVRYPRNERDTLSELKQVRIRTPRGYEVPFFSVADIHFTEGYSSIRRVDGQRRVVVTAEVDPKKANSSEILAELRNPRANGFNHGSAPPKPAYLKTLTAKYPGLSWAFMGAKEDSRETMESLRRGFTIALLGIFVIVATMFRSYIQPFIIMVSIPFGIMGAVYGHMLLGLDLTILSMFGIVALAGVVVNDAIILIECINTFVAEGTPFFKAIARGGARRFRAIFLTTMTTCAGLMPIILEKDMQAQFLIPMALSIAAGVAFSTMVTLVLIPSLMGILNDMRRILGLVPSLTGVLNDVRSIKHAISNVEWPSPEDVEPATQRYAHLEDKPATGGKTAGRDPITGG